MAEWLKAHAWKACLGETLTWVRIPLSPPHLLYSLRHLDIRGPCVHGRSSDAFSRPSASSQRCEIRSSERRASASGSTSSCQSCSRPRRRPRARPAPASTCRCFVTAWRVTPTPSLSREIESGPSRPRRATKRNRLWSPRAANTGAVFSIAAVSARLFRLDDITSDVLKLRRPAFRVHAERLGSARERDMAEAGLRHLD